jgi:hypothetical protein
LRKEEKVEAKSDLGEQLDSRLSQAEAAEQLASILAQSPALSQPESPHSVAHSEEPEPENAQAVHPKFTEQLEQIFAASPDSSLVFRGTTGSSTPTGFEEWQNQAPPSISEHIETEQSSVVINDSTETASDR